MKECRCDTVKTSDLIPQYVVHDHVRYLKHTECNGVYRGIYQERRDTSNAPHMSNVEYRADGDGT